MSFTQGEMYYNEGIIAIGLLVIISIIISIVLRYNKKTLIKRIDEDF